MAAVLVEHAQYFLDNGLPAVGGKIYIGVVDLEPVANPQNIFSDREMTVGNQLSNPQTIGDDGRSANKIWTDGKYSKRVDDSDAVQIYQELDNGSTSETGVTSLSNVQGTNTITAEAASTITAYVDKELFVFITANAITGAVTLNIDAVGAKAINKLNDQALVSGDLEASQVVVVAYNSTDDVFELVSQLGQGAAKAVQIFTADGTYTRPAGLTFAIVEVVGGGGGGGGSADTAAGEVSSGGGGGGGGYARKLLTAATITSSQTITHGTGGAGNSGAAGDAGTTGSFGSLVTGTGGGNGTISSASATGNSGTGGAGGIGTGGDFNAQGNGGGAGNASFGAAVRATGGVGGSSYLGGGARTLGSAGSGSAGKDGTNHGGGGSGAQSAEVGGTAQAGGAGSDGIIVVTEFF